MAAASDYVVLARKWRPQTFHDLVGQEHVVRALGHALDAGRLHHAYLFTGSRGVGKTTISRIFAKAVNCEQGMTSNPCNVCANCVAINEGRFVDYIEMDAASNRGVEEMSQLIEKAVYAPTVGHYKVYMIDEVHMLTNHAFNAMLKTLEEPPEHVKFILATTDPQKIPVTVLSRCLQFNLKLLPAPQILSHLQNILDQEKIPCEDSALRLIAKAAHGSMRDALSLTDQAIAYGNQSVMAAEVEAMLGTLDQSYIIALLSHLAKHDANQVFKLAKDIESRGLSMQGALGDLAQVLHHIAWYQQTPESLDDSMIDTVQLAELSKLFSPELIQLYYQVATYAHRDMALAPDEFTGFTMALLRMLAFSPLSEANTPTQIPPRRNDQSPLPSSSSEASKLTRSDKPAPKSMPLAHPSTLAQTTLAAMPPQNQVDLTVIPSPAVQEPSPNAYTAFADQKTPSSSLEDRFDLESTSAEMVFNGDWRSLTDKLVLSGMSKQLALQSELIDYDHHSITLKSAVTSIIPSMSQKLELALSQYFKRPIKLKLETGEVKNSPAMAKAQEKAQAVEMAMHSLSEHPIVKTLVSDLSATIIANSVQVIQ